MMYNYLDNISSTPSFYVIAHVLMIYSTVHVYNRCYTYVVLSYQCLHRKLILRVPTDLFNTQVAITIFNNNKFLLMLTCKRSDMYRFSL